jgi:hypothetical protein
MVLDDVTEYEYTVTGVKEVFLFICLHFFITRSFLLDRTGPNFVERIECCNVSTRRYARGESLIWFPPFFLEYGSD